MDDLIWKRLREHDFNATKTSLIRFAVVQGDSVLENKWGAMKRGFEGLYVYVVDGGAEAAAPIC